MSCPTTGIVQCEHIGMELHGISPVYRSSTWVGRDIVMMYFLDSFLVMVLGSWICVLCSKMITQRRPRHQKLSRDKQLGLAT